MAKNDKAKQKEKIVAVLNEARALELNAIHQYMNQHYNLDSMDFGELAAKLKLIAIDEMRHAEMFAERIKELDGEPVTAMSGKVEKGQEVEMIFSFDSTLEDDTIVVYNQYLKVAVEQGDSITAKLFEQIIVEEQAHYNYFDNVSGHIGKLGAAYLARIAGTPSETGLAAQGFVAREAAGA